MKFDRDCGPRFEDLFHQATAYFHEYVIRAVRLTGHSCIVPADCKSVVETEDGIVVEPTRGVKYGADCVASEGIGTMIAQGKGGTESLVLDSGYAVAQASFPRDTIKLGSPAQEPMKTVEQQP